MSKLIDALMNAPADKKGAALARLNTYLDRHPMAACLISLDAIPALRAAGVAI